MTQVCIVHPDDMNLADVKAVAAKYGANVVGSKHMPRGTIFIADEDAALKWRDADA